MCMNQIVDEDQDFDSQEVPRKSMDTLLFVCLFVCFLTFLGLHLQLAEVPRLGVNLFSKI